MQIKKSHSSIGRFNKSIPSKYEALKPQIPWLVKMTSHTMKNTPVINVDRASAGHFL